MHHDTVFRRFAGSWQLRLRTFDDLLRLPILPAAHWVATACPTTGLNCDPAFLNALDSDGNARVRVTEVLDAVAWTGRMLSAHENCVPGSDTLLLAHLTADAAPLRATAEQVLSNLAVTQRDRITLAQVRETKAILNRVSANGDGIISPEAVDDPAARQLVTDILAHLPGATDISGSKGVDQATLKAFATAREAAIAWLDQGQALARWGADSLAIARDVRAAQTKIDEWFLQCRIIATQPDAAQRFRLTAEKLEALVGDHTALRQAASALPIAPHDLHGVLSFDSLFRSPHDALLMRVCAQAIQPLFPGTPGRPTLDETQWAAVLAVADPLLAWDAERSKHPLLALGEARLRAITPADIAGIDALCVADLAVGEQLKRAGELEKLILCQRWLFTLANTMVAMPDLYAANGKALFEQGRLVMAGREFHLSVLVADRAAHSAMAGEASMFILYCAITGGMPERKFEVAVPVTSGTSRGLFVGKRGIFVTPDGKEHDAVVTQILTNPVSLVEAIYMPFIRICKFITGKIEKWSKTSEGEFDKQLDEKAGALSTVVSTAATAKPDAKAAAPAAAPGGQVGQILMGGGIAFAAIGSTLAFLVSTFAKIEPHEILLGLAALVGVLALPSAVLAFLKIRSRNLAVVLEASGWALNDRLRLTRKLGLLFTRRPGRPTGSKLELRDEVDRLIAKNPEAIAELKRQRRQAFWSWFLLALVIGALCYAWSGLLRDHLQLGARAAGWERVERWLARGTQVEPKPGGNASSDASKQAGPSIHAPSATGAAAP